MPYSHLYEKALHGFTQCFGFAPHAAAVAPGRVEVLGNHTDYNQGYTLSAAIDRFTVVVIGQSPDGAFHCASDGHAPITMSALEIAPNHSWINYPLGVYAMLAQKFKTLKPFSMYICGNIPLGAGLSSSASLEVATGLALSEMYSLNIEDDALAKMCQKAEHEWCGTKCGLLDQYSVLFAKKDHLLFTEYRTLTHSTVALGTDDLSLCISVSGVTHSLATSAYNDRRRECFSVSEFFTKQRNVTVTLRDVSLDELLAEEKNLDPIDYKRALHIVLENRRVILGMELLANKNYIAFGALFFDSHESSRVYFENSCSELDALVFLAKNIPGVLGSRLSGGGFGGATLSLVKNENTLAFEEKIKMEYYKKTGLNAVVYCAKFADGAKVLGI